MRPDDPAATVGGLPPWGETTVVGKPLPRVDAYERVTGTAIYTGDVSFPDMLHLAILRSPHAHARVKQVDAQAARQMPGVCAVLTDADPEANVVPPYPNWIENGPPRRLFDRHCRYAGEEVAAVAAETRVQAEEALRAIAVAYEELPFVLDAGEALKPGAPAVHEGGNLCGSPALQVRGDVQAGFAEADAVVEETYQTACEIHATLETLSSVARWDGDRLTVWESSQAVFDQREYLASALGLPQSSVRVVCRYMGGGFGSKAELSKHTLIAVLLARKTARPVKSVLTREESFLCAGNRPPNTITLKAGARKDGALSAIDLTNVGVVGAYPDDAGGGVLAALLYACPNVRIHETAVFVNAGRARPMRAPGFPQCAWALEQAIDALADRLGMDPVELRLKNVPAHFQGTQPVPYSSSGLKDCLIEGARAFGWSETRSRPRTGGPIRRGVGVAACMWPNPGGPPATAILKLLADGSLTLITGVSEIGTGAKTILAMVASEELGIPLDQIQIEWADTATTPYAQVTGGSRTTVNNTPAVRAAAVEIRRQLLELAAEELKRSSGDLLLKGGKVVPVDAPALAVAIAELMGLRQRQEIVAIGHRHPRPPKLGLPHGAHFVEVEVNTRTGETRIVRFLAVHDSGRVMNRLTYDNQVFGGVTMGIGFGLTEQRILDRRTGRVLSANLHDYQVPTALDVPADISCLPIDVHDTECNTTGTKGLGEPATIPTAAAIANAVFHATGIRVTRAPITPMRLLALLDARRARATKG
jgi:CO/xanthine dehydrogenase Mo-binding subunit